MAQLRTADGGTISTEDLSRETNRLIQRVLETDVVLDPITGEDAEADPNNFLVELQDYLRGSLRLKKADTPPVEFLKKGRIGQVIYWIFESRPKPDHDLYLFVIRNDYVTEILCVEKAITYMEPISGDLFNRIMTPEQAVLLEYCTTDYQPPPKR